MVRVVRVGRLLEGLACLVLAVPAVGLGPTGDRAPLRPRVIVSTDFPPLDVIPVRAPPGGPPWKRSDPDDVQSMVRFLLYSNEFDVEGLVASSGTLANVANKQNLLDMLHVYEIVRPVLARHDRRYPTGAHLRSVTWQGRDGTWGSPAVGTAYKPLETVLGPGKDSEASEAITRVIDARDPRPVWVCVWGGSREIAQALWKVKATRSPAQLKRLTDKVRIYLVAKQDPTADWLLETFPDLFIILSEHSYMGMFWNMVHADPSLSDLAWIDTHIRKGHGPLGAAYPPSGWDPAYPGTQEGDTPSFLYLLSAIRGVSDASQPGRPGWGGRFIQPDPAQNHWFDAPEGTDAISKWRADVQADFAARLEWLRER